MAQLQDKKSVVGDAITGRQVMVWRHDVTLWRDDNILKINNQLIIIIIIITYI